jgi:hypothetical protein
MSERPSRGCTLDSMLGCLVEAVEREDLEPGVLDHPVRQS